MPLALRRSAPLVLLLFAFIKAAYAEDILTDTEALTAAKQDPGAKEGQNAAVTAKQEELKRRLLNPPHSFHKLLGAVPLSIYGKDRKHNYVCFCDSGRIDWEVVSELQAGELRDYVTYFALFFWSYVDRRTESSLTLVVDADGFSMSKVLNGSAKAVLNNILAGMDDTIPYVGERPGYVFIINAPKYLNPLINFISRWVPKDVKLSSYSGRDKWEKALKEHIGEENLPIKYGGSNRMPLESSLVVKYISESVRKLMTHKNSSTTSKL